LELVLQGFIGNHVFEINLLRTPFLGNLDNLFGVHMRIIRIFNDLCFELINQLFGSICHMIQPLQYLVKVLFVFNVLLELMSSVFPHLEQEVVPFTGLLMFNLFEWPLLS